MHLQNKRRIGIITGTGPYAGIDLWDKILKVNQGIMGADFRGDIDCPELYIFSIPDLGLSMQLERFDYVIWEKLKNALLSLDKLVDAFIIACNTLHYYNLQIEKLNLKATFISINKVLETYLNNNNIAVFALIGVNTIDISNKYFPFQNLLEKYQIERLSLIILDKLHKLSIDIKRKGVTDLHKRKMIEVLKGIKSETCVLACTEFPLLNISLPYKKIVDLNLLLARSVVHFIRNS